jgi:ElaB/YqjD/DUF883 family membrane-anchored ribosome-binding protein
MNSMSNAARDAAKDAKDAMRESSKAASAGARDIEDDLQALRDDVARLTQQLAGIFANKGSVAWRRAKSNVEGMISEAQDKGMEAVGAVREVGDNMVDAIDESLKRRPYTTLALALGIGFLFGATWKR